MNLHLTSPTSTMRSASSTSTSIDSKIGYNFSVPRPLFLHSPMSSLQAAVATGVGDSMNLSPLRYSRPSTSYADLQLIHQSSTSHSPPPGLYQRRSDSMIVPSSTTGCYHTANTSPSAFSSLRQASAAAGLNTCDSHMTVLSNQWPINQSIQAPQDSLLETSQTLQYHSVISSSRYEAEYNEEEPEMSWDPPIREATFSTSSPLPVYSPLTVPTFRSTPTTRSHSHEYASTHQGHRYLATNGQTSGSRPKSSSPHAFVPIQEWDNEIDETTSYKENTTYCSSSPSKLSSASKSWEPRVDFSSNGTGIDDGHDSQYYYLHSRYRNEAYKPLLSSNLKTPTKASSNEYDKQGCYGSSNKMAPSPTFTVETADMTLDTPSIDESRSIDNRSIKASSLLSAMGAPPIYSSSPEPTSNSLRGNDSYQADMTQTSVRRSSLSTAFAAGQHREYAELVAHASRSSHQTSLQAHGISSIEYPPYNYCYSVPERDEAQHNRPQSAPTIGRPSFITPTKNEEDAQQRKCRVKTELCMHYENGRPCPFGTSTYLLNGLNSQNKCVILTRTSLSEFCHQTVPMHMARRNFK